MGRKKLEKTTTTDACHAAYILSGKDMQKYY